MKKVIILLFIIQCQIVYSQENFELLLPWNNEENISVNGLISLEDQNGDFFILGNIQLFEDSTIGIPIEGSITLGSGIIKLSSNGQIIWQELYSTNHYGIDGVYSRGRVPSKQIIFNLDEQIILPFSKLIGLLYCDSINSNIAATRFKKGIFNLDSETGEIIQEQLFLDDVLCEQDEIVGIKKTNFGYIMLYYDNFYHFPLYIEKLNTNFELLSVDTFENETKWIQFSKYDENILIASQTGFSIIDYEANILQTYDIEIVDTLFSTTIKWAENPNYYVFGMTDYSYQERLSTLYIIDKQGNTISNAYYNDKVINDVEITDDNEVLVLFDLSRNNFYDTISQPVQINKFDISLNLTHSKKYGFPFISPNDIKLTHNQESFLVTGTRFKSIDLVNGKEADQIYFLKGQINNLLLTANDNVSLNKPKINLYPNPSSKNVTIKLQNTYTVQNYIYEIIDNYGRIIISRHLNNNQTKINIENLTSGIYYIKVSTNNNSFVEKIVIQ